MRHFFTKAIVCAGVMASALALSSMAVFATTYNASTHTGPTTSGTTVTESWDFSVKDSMNATSSNIDLVNGTDDINGILPVNGTTRLPKTGNQGSGGFVSFASGTVIAVPAVGDGTIIYTNQSDYTKDRYVSLAKDGVAIGTSQFLNKTDGNTFNFKDANLTTINEKKYIELIFTGGEAKATAISISSDSNSAASTSCAVTAPTGYEGTFTLYVNGDESNTDVSALVAGDVVSVTYDGLDYIIDNFNYTITSSNVEDGSVALTVNDNNKHQISYTITGDITTPSNFDGNLTVGGATAAISNGVYTATTNYSSDNTIAVSGSYSVDVNSFDYSKTTITGYNATITQPLVISGIDKSNPQSFTYWFDEADTTTAGSYVLAGGELKLLGTFTEKTNTYDGHKSYKSTGKATNSAYDSGISSDDNKRSANYIPTAGTAYAFTPWADGTVEFYNYIPKTKSASIAIQGVGSSIAVVNKINGDANNDGEITASMNVSKGNTYYVFCNNSTGNTEFFGFKYEVDSSSNPTTFFVADTSKNYAVTYVSEAELANSSLNLAYNNSNLFDDDVTEVYESVLIGSDTYTAETFGFDNGYLYASEISDIASSKTYTDIESVVKNITKSFS